MIRFGFVDQQMWRRVYMLGNSYAGRRYKDNRRERYQVTAHDLQLNLRCKKSKQHSAKGMLFARLFVIIYRCLFSFLWYHWSTRSQARRSLTQACSPEL